MKKLMIAVAIVCAAALSQAAQFKWQANGSPAGALYSGTSSTLYSVAPSATLYLFDAAVVTQSDLFDAVVKNKKDISSFTKVTSTTLNASSKPVTADFDYGTVLQTYDYYFATVFNNGKDDILYISSIQANKKCPESGTTTFSWADLANNSKTTITGATSFGNAGAYAIPEPTSGLLLLLGVAGLALKRRRA